MLSTLPFVVRRLLACALVAFAVVASASPAKAIFHLWAINEVFTNSSGTVQFIELLDTFGGQQFIGGQELRTFSLGAEFTNVITIPNNLTGSTTNHSLLFGTAGLQAAGGPAPDYIIPDGFLFQAGGSISFFGINSGEYTALPIDGVHSRMWLGGNDVINSPRNFAGQTGRVPAPGSLGIAAGAAWVLGRRRRAVDR